MPKLKVLFATSEIAPLIKTGGLADVSAALPVALRAIGIDVQVLLPGYTQVFNQLGEYEVLATFGALTGFPIARLLSTKMANGLPLLVLDCPDLFRREGGPYQNTSGQDWADNALRFGLLSKVAAVLGSGESPLEWHPDLIHCNDWQTGLAPAYLHFLQGAVPSVVTIHNLAFQGNFPPTTVAELQLPPECFSMQGVEFYGNLSFLKAGLVYANHITTVSPTYAKEIQQAELGFGLQGLLTERNDSLTGILNGIDTDEWNPAADKFLKRSYDAQNLSHKSENKGLLQYRMRLRVDSSVPLLGVVSRFTQQKGLDVLLEIAPRLVELPVQLVMLGSGDVAMQNAALELSKRYAGKIAAHIGFSESLSHLIEAGSDIFVMPSRFEPCGLNQFYSQRYGTPPIVHETGGLADSVVDCTEEMLNAGSASGFSFNAMTAENLFATIQRAVNLYHQPSQWQALQKNCMTKNFSWEVSAEAYQAVYRKILAQ
ncbi:MAG: glycogen synthase GlgA [Gallionella sp.]|nr:glycogen synthase GlgA [Gallionella sp.]